MAKSKRKPNTIEDYLKAVKRADRAFELENENGFVAHHKVHKSKKTYTRKSKHKERYF